MIKCLFYFFIFVYLFSFAVQGQSLDKEASEEMVAQTAKYEKEIAEQHKKAMEAIIQAQNFSAQNFSAVGGREMNGKNLAIQQNVARLDQTFRQKMAQANARIGKLIQNVPSLQPGEDMEKTVVEHSRFFDNASPSREKVQKVKRTEFFLEIAPRIGHSLSEREPVRMGSIRPVHPLQEKIRQRRMWEKSFVSRQEIPDIPDTSQKTQNIDRIIRQQKFLNAKMELSWQKIAQENKTLENRKQSKAEEHKRLLAKYESLKARCQSIGPEIKEQNLQRQRQCKEVKKQRESAIAQLQATIENINQQRKSLEQTWENMCEDFEQNGRYGGGHYGDMKFLMKDKERLEAQDNYLANSLAEAENKLCNLQSNPVPEYTPHPMTQQLEQTEQEMRDTQKQANDLMPVIRELEDSIASNQKEIIVIRENLRRGNQMEEYYQQKYQQAMAQLEETKKLLQKRQQLPIKTEQSEPSPQPSTEQLASWIAEDYPYPPQATSKAQSWLEWGNQLNEQRNAIEKERSELLRQIPPVPKPEKEEVIQEGVILGTFTTQKDANDLMANGISPFTGKSYKELHKSGKAMAVSFGTPEDEIFPDLLRAGADHITHGMFSLNTPWGQKIVNSLRGKHFNRLVVHSNGASIAEALITQGIISVEQLHVVGGDRGLGNPYLQELLDTGKVKRVLSWVIGCPEIK